MIHRNNVGTREALGRVPGGARTVACSPTLAGITPLGRALAGSGVVTALTGLFGHGPACAMAGRPPIEHLP